MSLPSAPISRASPARPSHQAHDRPGPLPEVPGAAGPTHAYPLQPGLGPWLRADGSLQFGVDPVHAVTLTGMLPGERAAVTRLLHTLSGASGPVPIEALARSSGLAAARVREVVGAIESAGLTNRDGRLEANAPAGTSSHDVWLRARRSAGLERTMTPGPRTALADRRAGSRVLVDGRGQLVTAIGQLLRQAAIGTVRTGWYAGISEDLDADAPDPTLIVTVGRRLPRTRAADWHRRGIPMLPVVAHVGSVDIGPLLIAGHGPCIECIRSGEGPALLHDLLTDDAVVDGQGEIPVVEPTLAGLTAGLVAMLALGVVDAYPPPLGVRWHTALPLPSIAASTWAVDPDCASPAHHHPIIAPLAATTVDAPMRQ